MLLPGSKGWINKYFSLLKEGEFAVKYQQPNGISLQRHLHILSGKTGIIFGHFTRTLFFNKEDSSKWTEEEKIKFLLFETLFLTYIQKYGLDKAIPEEFVSKLNEFYDQLQQGKRKSLLGFLSKKDEMGRLEEVLTQRIDVSKGILDNRWWFKTMSNVFIYLDVVLFNRFLNEENGQPLDIYSEYAYNALVAILLAAYSDGIVDEKEESMFRTFLSSANLEGSFRDDAISSLKNGVSYHSFTPVIKEDKLLCRFIIDLSLLTIFGNQDIDKSETDFVKRLAEFLNLEDYHVEESFSIIENFLLYSDVKSSFLSSKSVYERVYSNWSQRWTKVILRNKDKLALELAESKELVFLIKKSATHELSAEEKEKVRTQFMDIVKSMPALAIFMLPGGAILLPLILKVLPTLIPSAFRDNE